MIRHPLARAHAAFCEVVLSPGGEELRGKLAARLGIAFDLADRDAPRHREDFAAFLGFLRLNLAGQTNLRVDPAWTSQAALLQDMSAFGVPDLVIRETDLATELPRLAGAVGREGPRWNGGRSSGAQRLASIYDPELERLGRAAMARDYLAFGFGPLTP